MDTTDSISIGAACISLLGVAVAWYFAVKAQRASKSALESAKQSNRIADAQLESAMRDGISAARERVEELLFKAEELDALPKPGDDEEKAQRKRRAQRLVAAVRAAIEEYLNRYDLACGQYLHGSVADSARFKDAYEGEVRSLCESGKHFIDERMQPEETSTYKQIWEVYRKWFRDGPNS